MAFQTDKRLAAKMNFELAILTASPLVLETAQWTDCKMESRLALHYDRLLAHQRAQHTISRTAAQTEQKMAFLSKHATVLRSHNCLEMH